MGVYLEGCIPQPTRNSLSGLQYTLQSTHCTHPTLNQHQAEEPLPWVASLELMVSTECAGTPKSFSSSDIFLQGG